MKLEQIIRHAVQAGFLALLVASGTLYRNASNLLDGYILLFLAGNFFCGWACPFGTLQELAGVAGNKIKVKRLSVPPKVDIGLSVFRYVPLIVAVGALASLDVRKPFQAFLAGGPVSGLAAGVAVLFFSAAVFVDRPFCRWVCPKGAAMGLLSLGRAVTIRRRDGACTGCGLCSRNCPMGIEVHKREQVVDPRCIGCVMCVSKCPRKGAIKVGWRKYAGIANIAATLFAAAFLYYRLFLHE